MQIGAGMLCLLRLIRVDASPASSSCHLPNLSRRTSVETEVVTIRLVVGVQVHKLSLCEQVNVLLAIRLSMIPAIFPFYAIAFYAGLGTSQYPTPTMIRLTVPTPYVMDVGRCFHWTELHRS